VNWDVLVAELRFVLGTSKGSRPPRIRSQLAEQKYLRRYATPPVHPAFKNVKTVRCRFGTIDVLVNNAGIISVAPLENITVVDFERAMAAMFWGVLYPTLAVLPEMKARGDGSIATITSLGGKISVPHLLPYSCAKFAAVAFSEGLRAEVARHGIRVTTIAPGLMRTGSHLKAEFKGQHDKEATWFTLSATSLLTSMRASLCARQIIAAIRQGKSEKILSTQANVIARLNGLFPGLAPDLFRVVNRLLPFPINDPESMVTGKDAAKRANYSLKAAVFNQLEPNEPSV
jgi:short-subunit dehydrogenase